MDILIAYYAYLLNYISLQSINNPALVASSDAEELNYYYDFRICIIMATRPRYSMHIIT